LYVAFNAPHGPLQASEKYLKRFAHIADEQRRTYAAMVSALDDAVGAILAELKAQGAEENTLIFFLSDNGGPLDQNASLWRKGFHARRRHPHALSRAVEEQAAGGKGV
jgi:arylsulfatase A-like enzyme